MRKRLMLGSAAVVLIAGGFAAGRLLRPLRPENQRAGRFSEQIVYAGSSDNVVSAGALFTALSQRLAVIWVHGWGVNFYFPSYVGIGRSLAALGYPTITVNTRMHDLGNVEKYTPDGKRVRGGGYWGITSEDARDIAAWIAYAEQLGYRRVLLAGHSAGWASVGRYLADPGDPRVAGVVFASEEAVGNLQGSGDSTRVSQAQKLVEQGLGEDPLKIPNRASPSFISAGTEFDTMRRPREFADFFGTKDDVGGERKLPAPSPSGPPLKRYDELCAISSSAVWWLPARLPR